ncbi:DUF3667 domain-containing protein [Chitinophaga barathri]|uniref:DUF3667 domain-containing protein n=1 Tax=Chitinophaga barathri TaxID=1647451 RepID=A0A3N4MHB3_9BACT|nr:DUF3667 domain-containing protein [Chitinophaga barathri]RPD39480.1 DUF3667 domain-containing protein [Chitinophaga barathri]
MNCRNCQQAAGGNYCVHCGTPAVLKRVDGHYIVHEIQHILHFEKGILYTVRALLLRPGQNIRAFLTENRSRLVKPVIFLIITSLLYTAVAHFFHTGAGHAAAGGQGHSATLAIKSWMAGHYGYANIIMGIFIALWLRLFGWKSGYNFFEILIMLCFVMGTGMLIFAVFTLVEGLTGMHLSGVTAAVSLIYCVWAIGQFLGGRKWMSYLIAGVAYLLGMGTFMAGVNLAGFLVDVVKRA